MFKEKKKKSSFLGKLTLYFFISAWMFTIGVFVGRETMTLDFDEDMQKEIQLESGSLQGEDAAGSGGGEGNTAVEESPEGEALGFHETLKQDESDLVEQFVLKRKPGSASEKKAASKDAYVKIKKRTPRKKDADKDGLMDILSREKGARAAKKPSRERRTIGGGEYTIQVASYRRPDEADKTVEKLRASGYDAYKATVLIPEKGLWHRVRIGSFGSGGGKASALIARLKREYGISAMVVKR